MTSPQNLIFTVSFFIKHIVKDLSRLGRNYIEMGKYLEQIFPMMRIRFIAINDNYDNANTESSDSDSIVVPFKNLLNDSYCRDISIKVRSQLDMKRRKGEFIGGPAPSSRCRLHFSESEVPELPATSHECQL